MHVQTRRQFLQTIPTSGLAFLSTEAVESEVASTQDKRASCSIPLRDGWEFRLDATGATEPSTAQDRADDWESVHVPHTWQSLGRSPDYLGIAWYRIRFEAREDWKSRYVRIEFEAVNHTATVFLNGQVAGEHLGKGYTAFTLNLSVYLSFGTVNTLLV